MEEYITDFSAAREIDDFSSENPKNRAGGRWKRLRRLRRSDEDFVQVEGLFHNGWRHPHKERRYVHRVYKIIWPDDRLEPYLAYRAQVASECSRTIQHNIGNEQLLFHGTTRQCLLAEHDDSTTLCMLPECSLCCIIRNSFDVARCGSKNKFRRFGTGIYTTGCSSKADDYVTNNDEKAQLRVLLVGRVVVGVPYNRLRNAVQLTKPPSGYHSVYGRPGGDLNYEETVVYNNAAIQPAYLIVYGDPPISQPPGARVRTAIKSLFKTPLAS
ncbi:hypothetical protein AX16_007353 [Volvariella volvacea WC 439]|nr:hypothetical protein AX16_007353 [Volvariella volvacea WC 439]